MYMRKWWSPRKPMFQRTAMVFTVLFLCTFWGGAPYDPGLRCTTPPPLWYCSCGIPISLLDSRYKVVSPLYTSPAPNHSTRRREGKQRAEALVMTREGWDPEPEHIHMSMYMHIIEVYIIQKMSRNENPVKLNSWKANPIWRIGAETVSFSVFQLRNRSGFQNFPQWQKTKQLTNWKPTPLCGTPLVENLSSHYLYHLYYHSRKVCFDRSGFESKATTSKDAKEKGKSTTMKDVEDFFREDVEQRKHSRKTHLFNRIRYQSQMVSFFINDLEKQKLRVGLLMMDIFNKCVFVVPIQSKGEGDIPARMIEALKIKENRNYYTQLARQIWTPRQFKTIHRTRGHRNFSDGARRTYIYIYIHTMICIMKG